MPMPDELHGMHLADVDIPTETGCAVIALVSDGHAVTQIDGNTILRTDADLLLVGDELAEERFLERYVATDRSGLKEKLTRLASRQP